MWGDVNYNPLSEREANQGMDCKVKNTLDYFAVYSGSVMIRESSYYILVTSAK